MEDYCIGSKGLSSCFWHKANLPFKKNPDSCDSNGHLPLCDSAAKISNLNERPTAISQKQWANHLGNIIKLQDVD